MNDMEQRAAEIFGRVPKTHNCAQTIAAAAGRDDLAETLQSCGGGRAPEGRCGALHAACLIAPEAERERLRQAFRHEFGTENCRELKQRGISCAACVAAAARLLDEVLSR